MYIYCDILVAVVLELQLVGALTQRKRTSKSKSCNTEAVHDRGFIIRVLVTGVNRSL